jgi:Domain of unknown function (DUF4416)
MATIRPPKRAVLLCGLLSPDVDLLTLARRRLVACFGDVFFETPTWPFDFTDFYESEMGEGILRRFLVFDDLVSVERLAEIKRTTNDIEQCICEDLGHPPTLRPVNIDPGYVTLSKLVLATTKDASHRIYLQRGIYAEATLRYMNGGWQACPWTYPDYAGTTYHAEFDRAREMLKERLSAEE